MKHLSSVPDPDVGLPTVTESVGVPVRHFAVQASERISTITGPVGGCDPVNEAEPQGLSATYVLDAVRAPGVLRMQYEGLRIGAEADDTQGRFTCERDVSLAAARGRPVAVTERLSGIPAGEWDIRVRAAWTPAATQASEVAGEMKLPDQQMRVRTVFAPLAHGPAVAAWCWPLLVGLGSVVAVALMAVNVSLAGGSAFAAVGISGVACAVGFLGARLWFLAIHRMPLRKLLSSGACIQGFNAAAALVLVMGAPAIGLSWGAVLDAAAPALLAGMAVGRPGCWLTGCCAGRVTVSRWSLWSSDRRVAASRYPVQLFEAAACGTLAIGAEFLFLGVRHSGANFVVGLAAYALVRQVLFPLRSDPHTRWGRTAVAAGALAAIAVAIWVMML